MTPQERRAAYQEHGCENRTEYLMQLAEEHDIDLPTVQELANLLGPNEDFDGLIVSLEDAESAAEGRECRK
jgi:phosphopantetheine adenylyltransferase